MIIITIILLILLVGSAGANMALGFKVQNYALNPVVKVEYKEIEVIRRATCECGHPYSMHLEQNQANANEGGCQQEFFELQGKKTTKSFKCFCVKYVGPVPVEDIFDAEIRGLDRIAPKELN